MIDPQSNQTLTLEQALEKIKSLEKEIKDVKDNNEINSSLEILRASRKIKDEMLAEASTQADEIVSTAKRQADEKYKEIVNEANDIKQKVLTEVQKQLDIYNETTDRLLVIQHAIEIALKSDSIDNNLKELVGQTTLSSNTKESVFDVEEGELLNNELVKESENNSYRVYPELDEEDLLDIGVEVEETSQQENNYDQEMKDIPLDL